ncbi:protein SODIUM POTASSIUM ROOT DEFECTIVE 3-like isoform X2 [Mangifera indica]|uniref:protein SODIUM POTASSIUM ROOT DEFECTIVE 3-like isoform X2 n=1 Tax=Mangifera indica TaxID=29780 RepID=UPI001CF9E17C|nr:protein SODIUM POTASSIUM ROOT DEFECTIVE 3-like isoform X2 [Mangifera indica]
MKGMDIFCSTPASTAVRSSMVNHRSIRRTHCSKTYAPCSSQFPIIPRPYHEKSRKSSTKQSDLRRKSSADINDLNSTNASSRYLLSDKPFIDWLSESDRVSALVPADQTAKPRHVSANKSPALIKSSATPESRDQVVVLRVSIHCKGCEGKVRKHISKMEGVTSFSIDLATKKVTIIGNVTPLGVLASVSRVKNAQLWPTSTTSSSSSP